MFAMLTADRFATKSAQKTASDGDGLYQVLHSNRSHEEGVLATPVIVAIHGVGGYHYDPIMVSAAQEALTRCCWGQGRKRRSRISHFEGSNARVVLPESRAVWREVRVRSAVSPKCEHALTLTLTR